MPTWETRAPRRGDQGSTVLEYAVVLALVAALATVVLSSVSSLGESTAQAISRSVCLALSDRPADCSSATESPAAPEDTPNFWAGAGRGEGPNHGVDDRGRKLPAIGDGRAPGEYRVGSFNMAGGSEDDYDADNAAQAILDSLEARQPAIMAIQEACDQAIAEVEDGAAEYSAVFNQVYSFAEGRPATNYRGARCKDDGGQFGTALIVHDDLDFDTGRNEEDRYDLTPAGQEFERLARRQMVCVTSNTHELAACTLHLTRQPNENDDDDRAELLNQSRQAEAEEVRRILDEEYGGYTIILGGDLNAEPDSTEADQFYHEDYGGGADGELIDASGTCGGDLAEGEECRDGESTMSNRKIDYVFVSEDVQVLDTEVGSPRYSDHELVWSDIVVDHNRS